MDTVPLNICFLIYASRAERKHEEAGKEAPGSYFEDELLDALDRI